MNERRTKVRRFAAVLTFVVATCVTGPAVAQDYVGGTPPEVGATDAGAPRSVIVQSASGVRQVGGTQAGGAAGVGGAAQVGGLGGAGRSSTGGLALTGGDIMGLVMLGAISLGAGLVVVRKARPSVR